MSEELAREFQREDLISASMVPLKIRDSNASDDQETRNEQPVTPNTADDLLLAQLLQKQFDDEEQLAQNRRGGLNISLGNGSDEGNARKLKNGDSIGDDDGKCDYFLPLRSRIFYFHLNAFIADAYVKLQRECLCNVCFHISLFFRNIRGKNENITMLLFKIDHFQDECLIVCFFFVCSCENQIVQASRSWKTWTVSQRRRVPLLQLDSVAFLETKMVLWKQSTMLKCVGDDTPARWWNWLRPSPQETAPVSTWNSTTASTIPSEVSTLLCYKIMCFTMYLVLGNLKQFYVFNGWRDLQLY